MRQGWDALIGDGPFIGMTGFGASAPYKALYKYFGITRRSGRSGADAAAAPEAAAKRRLSGNGELLAFTA